MNTTLNIFSAVRALARSVCGAALASLAIALPPAAAHADSGYRPALTWLKRVDSLHVQTSGAHTLTVEMLLRIETEAGVENYSEQRVDYSSSLETLEVLEAWTETPDGKRLWVAADKIRTMEAQDGGGPQFSDAKVKVIIFPAVSVGAKLYLRYRSQQHTPHFPGHATWSLHYPSGVRFEDARVEITHEPGVPLQVDARGAAGGKQPPRADDAPGTVRYAFSFRQDEVWPPERGRVALSDFAPYVQATTFADRAAVAAAYQAGSRAAAEPTAAIRALAAELTAGATTEREKVRRLYQWVSRHIRYVSLEVGVGGYVPHSAQSVLEQRYGDCKDHVVLLEALLRAVGIESSPALVNAGRAYKLPRLALFTPFDHVITYVPSLDLYLDATARFAPVGALPHEVMDKPVLLTATGREARTPRTHPSSNHTHTRVWMQVSDSGEVWGSSVAVMRGVEEVDSRSAQFGNLGRRQEDLARQYLARFGESGLGRIEVEDPLDLDKPWEVKSTFELDPVVNVPGPAAMAIPVGLAPGHIRWLAKGGASSPSRFEHACVATRHREEIELRMPHNVRIQRIPKPVSYAKGPIRYSATYQRSGNLVRITRDFSDERAGHVCNASDDELWVDFLRVLQRDLRSQVFVR